jgi:hypothetical protein
MPLLEMITGRYKAITYKLIITWFSLCFMYYGIMLLLPLMLANRLNSNIKFNYLILVAVNSMELMGMYSSYVIIELLAVGRKKTMSLTFLVVLVASAMLFIIDAGPLLLGILLVLVKFSATIGVMVN